MRRYFLLTLFLLLGVAVAVLWAGRPQGKAKSAVSNALPVARIGDSSTGLVLAAGSQTSLGAFVLDGSRTVRLATAETTDGKECLLESSADDPGSSVCLDGGLFGVRKVAFAVDSQGGPDRFTELRVPGIVAPGIRAAEILKSDGSSSRLELTSRGAFVYESPHSELRESIYPSGFRLYGANGKLVEVVRFPANP
jgi:hypothetical protein